MNSTHRGWGPARGASRPPRPAPTQSSLATGRVDHAAWCRPSPRVRRLGTNHLDSVRMARIEKGAHETTREKLAWLEQLRDEALHAGSPKSVARHREQGKLLA